MYDKTLARRILETLDLAFPRKLHLHELKASLLDYKSLSDQDWLAAVDALRLEGKLNGAFLPEGMSIADAAAMYITEGGRLQLQESASPERANKLGMGLQVFLCHSSRDKEAVRVLFDRLKRDGFAPWLDEENILPGQDWDNEIRRAVRLSHVVVVCLSKSSVTKEGYVQKEIKLALDVADEKPAGTIFLIPAQLEPCEVPERLKGWQWVDLFDSRGYGRLVAALRKRQAQLPGPPDETGSSRRAGQPPINARPEAPVSLADKMKHALEERGMAEEAARVKQQRQAELRESARKAGPVQFETLAALLRAKGDALNNKKLPGFPEFKYVPVNHRLDAGKYAIELTPYAALDSYSVMLLVGLHPNAAQFLVEVPDIPTRRARLNASMDQDGFCWRDAQGIKCDINQVLDDAMEALCNLILEDISR